MNTKKIKFSYETTILGFAIFGLLCTNISAKSFDLPTNGGNVVGNIKKVDPNQLRADDNFLTLSERYGIGFHELEEANPNASPWTPNYDDIIIPDKYVLPSVRKGIVINLPELRLYYFPEGTNKVYTFPVGIGKKDWTTPTIKTNVTHKMVNPTWNVPKSIKQEYAERGDTIADSIPAGPDNPLGKYAMRLGSGSYLLHGSNKKIGVGLRVSHGCIRLFNPDIKQLFDMVPIGTEVTIVNEPYKIGTDGDQIYLEAHKPLSEDKDNFVYSKSLIKEQLYKLGYSYNIDWNATQYIANDFRGIPAPIGNVRHVNSYLD